MKISCTETAGKAASSSSATQSNLEGEQLPLNRTARVKSNECCIPYKARLFYRAGTGSQAPGTNAIGGPQNGSCTSISSPAPAQPQPVVGCSGVSAGGTPGRCLRSIGEPGAWRARPPRCVPPVLKSWRWWPGLTWLLALPKSISESSQGRKEPLVPPFSAKNHRKLKQQPSNLCFFKIF